MYCVKCGTQLPDSASFCLSCGTPQKVGLASPAVPASSTEFPVAIDSVLLWTGGPHETRKVGLTRDVQDGRGFGVAIYLKDNQNMWTAYPGNLHILIKGTSMGYPGMIDLIATKSSIKKAVLREWEGDMPISTAFYKEMPVSSSEFTWNKSGTKLGFAYLSMDKPTWLRREKMRPMLTAGMNSAMGKCSTSGRLMLSIGTVELCPNLIIGSEELMTLPSVSFTFYLASAPAES